MPAILPWFERKFPFAFPVEKHPDIVERLSGTPVRVEEKVATIPPEILTARRGGTWSIQENVGHLLDLEPLWAGRVDDIFEGISTMREADLSNRKTHEAEHNRATIDALTRAFRNERVNLVRRLSALRTDDFARTAKHPRLGTPMRLVDLCLFVADHDDYHLARMTELATTG